MNDMERELIREAAHARVEAVARAEYIERRRLLVELAIAFIPYVGDQIDPVGEALVMLAEIERRMKETG